MLRKEIEDFLHDEIEFEVKGQIDGNAAVVHVELTIGVDAHTKIEKADTGFELCGYGKVLGAYKGDVGFCAAC